MIIQGMQGNIGAINEPLPQLGRMMVFIDGENLVLRYENMLAEGAKPTTLIEHIPKVFVWRANTINPDLHVILRTTYYTYATADDKKINEIIKLIKDNKFHNYSTPNFRDSDKLLPCNITPKVFKKPRGKKAKGVDIQICVDILSNVYQNNLDTVYLVTGDGDYLPVINETIRMGKQVYLAAFSSGLNQELVNIADKFRLLDPIYFKNE